jgi:hypothetical protein
MDEPKRKEDAAGAFTQEGAYLKLLHTLKNLEPTGHELGVVKSIALWNPSPRVLAAIGKVSKWRMNWEIREALYQNSETPKKLKDECGRCIAVINLIYELDKGGLEESEKEEIREDIRYLVQTLGAEDKKLVETKARELAVLRDRLLQKKEEQAALTRKAESEMKDRLDHARTTADAAEVLQLLRDENEAVRSAALENPHLDESTVLKLAGEDGSEPLLESLARNRRWFFRDKVRRCFWKNPHCPPSIRSRLGAALQIWKDFKRFESGETGRGEKRALAEKLATAMSFLEKPEQDYMKGKMGPAWGAILSQVLTGIEEEIVPRSAASPERDREREEPSAGPIEGPVSEAEPDWSRAQEEAAAEEAASAGEAEAAAIKAAEEAVPGLEAESGAEDRDSLLEAIRAAAGFEEEEPEPAPPAVTPGEDVMKHRSLPETIKLAGESRLEEEIGFLLHHHDIRVFAALLDNPALSSFSLLNIARSAPLAKVEKIHASRWFSDLQVRNALMHNPHTPLRISSEILNTVGNVRELLAVMRDRSIPSHEIKTKARSRLMERYKSMSSEEKVAAIKSTGGEILNHLWTEAFVDERVFLTLLRERALDQNIVLKLARSSITPRNVLAEIGRSPIWNKNYQVILELVQNPKTPREVAQQLFHQLTPADRKRLRAQAFLPVSLQQSQKSP